MNERKGRRQYSMTLYCHDHAITHLPRAAKNQDNVPPAKHSNMRAVALVLLSMSLGVRVYAQTGGIEGQIIDRDGKPLAGVTVSIFRIGFNQRFEAKSDGSGRYTHIALPSGRYELTITKDGKSLK